MLAEYRYAIKEIFNTLQGEGRRAGKRSVFLRFTGCNLWNGLALSRDRGLGPCSLWCDSDFAKGTVMTLEQVMEELRKQWPVEQAGPRWVVLTGGEPTLQVNAALIDALKAEGWLIAIETNGSIANPELERIDWVCVSPKYGVELAVKKADELKVVLPGVAPSVAGGWTDEELEELVASGDWGHLYAQPQDVLLSAKVAKTSLVHQAEDTDEETEQLAAVALNLHLQRAIEFVMTHPKWSLSMQTHKLLGLP